MDVIRPGRADATRMRQGRGWQRRAPVRRALLAGWAQVGLPDPGAAAQAAAAAAVDPELVAGPAVAGGDPGEAVLVGLEQRLGLLDDEGQVGHGADRGARVDAAEEAELGLVDVADAGEVALVEERVADRASGSARRLASARSASQSGPSRSGPRWPTRSSSRSVRTRSRITGSRRPRWSACAARRGRCGPAGASGCRPRWTAQWPSIFRWVCRVTPLSKRVSRCLPRETVSTTVAPERSLVASDGIRKSLLVSTWPDRPFVEPLRGCAVDGVALRHGQPRSAALGEWR